MVLLGFLLLWVVLLCASRFSSVGWCCLHSPPPGSVAFPSSPCALWTGVFFVLREPAPLKGGGGRQHDQKKEDSKQDHPQGRGGKAAPLKGRRRDHHTTEHNFASVFLTCLNCSFDVSHFSLGTAPPNREEENQHHKKGDRGKAPPPKGGEGRDHHQKER